MRPPELLVEADENLDTHCYFSFSSPNNPVAEFSKKMKITLNGNLILQGKNATLVFRIPESHVGTREASILIKQFRGIEDHGVTIIAMDVTGTAPTMFLTSLLSVRSVVLYHISLNEGLFHAYVRFNSSDLDKFSDLILQGPKQLNDFSIEFLGRSKIPLEGIKSIGTKDRHSYIEIFANLDRQNEVDNVDGKCVLHLKALSNENWKWYCLDNRLFSSHTEPELKLIEKLQNSLFSECLRRSIMISSLIHKHEGGLLRTGVLLPTIYLSSFLEVVSEINRKETEVEYFISSIVLISDIA